MRAHKRNGEACPGTGRAPGFVPSHAIPNSAAQGNDLGPDSQAGSSATRRDAGALGRATRNRAARVWVGIETYNWGEEIDHVRVFTGKDKAEQWRDEKPMVRGIEEAEVE